MMAMGISEMLLVLLTSGMMNGGGMLGLPPGERDAAFTQTAPADSLVYFEWAERSEGEADAEGIDGLAADPEIKLFLAQIEKAILAGMDRGLRNEGPEAQTVAKAVPPMLKLFLMQPGCAFARFDEEAAAKALTQSAGNLDPAAAAALGIEGAIVINAGDGADEFGRHIESLLNLPGAVPPSMRKRGLARQVIPLPVPTAKLEIHREGDYFVLAFGDGVVDEVIPGLTGKSKGGLTTNERYTKAMANVATERVASVMWADSKGILAAVVSALDFQGQMAQMIANSTGLDKVDSVVTVSGVVDGRLSSRCFVTTGGSLDGLLALAAGRGVTAKDLTVVPGDADLVLSFSFDSKKVLAAVRDIVQKSDPTGFTAKAMNDTLEQLDEELGFSIEDDALEAFGDTLIVFDSPSAGGLVLTGVTAALEVRDHERATKIYGRLMDLLDAQMPGIEQGEWRRSGAVLAKATFMDHEIRYVNILDDEVPFSPAFCLTKTHLLVAPHPQPLKAQLRFLATDESNFGSRLGDVVPDSDDPAISVGYLDARAAVQALYSFAPMFGSIVFGEMQRNSVEMDVFSLPSARAVLPYTKDSYTLCTRKPDGLLIETYNGLPVPTGGVAFVQMPMFLWFAAMGAAADVAPARMAPAQRVQAVPVPAVRVQAVERAKVERAKAEAEATKAKAAAERAKASEKAATKRANESKPVKPKRTEKPAAETRP